jgi:regulator of protease activity HflC (stomatin/prohibitin superfamily)
MISAIALTPYSGDSEVQAAQTEIRTIADDAAELEIVDDATNVVALDMLSRARKAAKRIDGLRARWLDPLNAQIKLIRADFDAMAAPAKEADAILADKTAEYRRGVAEAAREQQARLDRLAALRQAQADAEAAELGVDALRVIPLAAVLEAPAKSVATEAGSKVTFRRTVHFEIADEMLVPREYLIPDERKIGAAVRAGVDPIPGVRVWTTEEPVVR